MRLFMVVQYLYFLAAYNATMTGVDGVYERDAGITMKLTGNTDKLMLLNANSDPFTNSSGDVMLDQNQHATAIAEVAFPNYDIGHVFSTGGGGNAQLRSPCSSNKAMGVTGQPAPTGDPFDIDYVAHEMGHQFGANHTQNNSCQQKFIHCCGAGQRQYHSGLCRYLRTGCTKQQRYSFFHAESV